MPLAQLSLASVMGPPFRQWHGTTFGVWQRWWGGAVTRGYLAMVPHGRDPATRTYARTGGLTIAESRVHPAVGGRLRIGVGSSVGAASGTQHDVIDVVRSGGGPRRAGPLLVNLDVPCGCV